MNRLTYLLSTYLFFTGALLLSGCTSVLNSENIDLAVTPDLLVFTVSGGSDSAAVSIPAHTLTFTSKEGAIGATVEGYSIEFYDASGQPLFAGDHVVNSRGSLNVYVPPGLACDKPSAAGHCNFNSPGVRYERGTPVTTTNSAFLPFPIASADYKRLSSGGALGARANFYLYGTNDLGNNFRAGPYQVAIQISLDS